MKRRKEKETLSFYRVMLGVFFLIISLAGLYWVADVIYQLWNSPKTVPLVTMFMDLVEEKTTTCNNFTTRC